MSFEGGIRKTKEREYIMHSGKFCAKFFAPCDREIQISNFLPPTDLIYANFKLQQADIHVPSSRYQIDRKVVNRGKADFTTSLSAHILDRR